MLAVLATVYLLSPAPEALQRIAAHMQTVESIDAELVQTKTLKLFASRVVTPGTFHFERPETLVIDLAGKDGSRLEISPRGLTTTSKLTGQSQTMKKDDPRAAGLMEQVRLLATANIEGLLQHYAVTLSEQGGNTKAILVPHHAEFRAVIANLAASFNSEGLLVELQITSGNGDITLWELRRHRVKRVS